MTYASNYQVIVINSLQNLYSKVLGYLPNLLAAIIIVILGWLVASFLSKIIVKVLEMIKIDHLANQLGFDKLSEKVGKPLSLAKLGGWLIKWFFLLGTFLAAADILNLSGVNDFLYTKVLVYAGDVVVAMAILLLGLLAANFFSGLVGSTVRASGLASSKSLQAITKWSILAFTFITVLAQLQIATSFLQDLFRAIVAMLAIAGGIAFGLGGKDHAKKVLDSMEEDLIK